MDHDWVFFLVVLPLIILLLNIAYFCLILLHELSHALPALIFTKGDVKIYIGHKSKEIELANPLLTVARLTIHIKPRLFYFRNGGFCVYNFIEPTITQNIIILISGSLVTMFLGISLCLFAFTIDAHGAIKLALVIFSLISILSFIDNLYPRTKRVYRRNESFSTDGFQARRLIRWKIKSALYAEGVEFYNQANFIKASEVFIELINENFIFPDLYRFAVVSLTKVKSYEKAKVINSNFFRDYASELNSDDYCSSGFVKSHLNLHSESYIDYSRSLELNPNNKISLSNRGYANIYLGNYLESIIDLDKAISIDDEFTYPYANRGLAKLKTGQIEDGLKDIARSIELDENNAYSYLHLGIYNFDIGNFAEAHQLFEKAKATDEGTHNVDDYINVSSG